MYTFSWRSERGRESKGETPLSRTRNHPLLRSFEQERRNDTRRNSSFSSRNLQPQIASKSFNQRFNLNFDQIFEKNVQPKFCFFRIFDEKSPPFYEDGRGLYRERNLGSPSRLGRTPLFENQIPFGSKLTWPLRVGEGDIDDWQTCLTGHGSLRGCWRVASEFSGFLSRGE